MESLYTDGDGNYANDKLYKDYRIVKCKSCYRKWHVSELKDSNCPGCGGAVSKPSSTGHWRESKSEQLVWCNPGSFSFKKDEIQWLLPLLKDIEGGFYVPEPRGGSYTDLGIMSRRIKAGAYFTLIMSIRGEVVWRLDQLYTKRDERLDRFLLEDFYCNELDYFKLAHIARIPADEVERRINRALNYISGNKRTITTYEDFVTHPTEKRVPCSEPKQGR